MKKADLKAIDGTKTTKAPAPKRGLSLAIFETIDGLGGATLAQVKRYLPAAITETNQVASPKKLLTALQNGIYRGYFISDGKIFRIAPRSYYNARQAYMNSLKGRRADHTPEFRPTKLPDLPEAKTGSDSLQINWWLLLLVAVLSGWTGVLVGVSLP
jgi:hypothetical protein